MKLDISVIKEKLNIYNQVFDLVGKKLSNRIYSDDGAYEFDNLTYDKYLGLPETLKVLIGREIVNGLKNPRSKIYKKVLELEEEKILGNLGAFYKYGEYLKESLKEAKNLKKEETLNKVVEVFKKNNKNKKKRRKIDLETIWHYIVMALIPIASISLFNFLGNLGIYVGSLTSYFTLGTIGIMGFKQVGHMFKKKREEKKEKELAERILELVREAEEKELENGKQKKSATKRKNKSKEFEYDLDYEDEEEVVEFDDKDFEDEEIGLPTSGEGFTDFEEEYDDELEEEEVELPTAEIQEETKKNKEGLPSGSFQDEEIEDFEDEEIGLPTSGEEDANSEEEYDDELEEEEVELPTAETQEESKKNKEGLPSGSFQDEEIGLPTSGEGLEDDSKNSDLENLEGETIPLPKMNVSKTLNEEEKMSDLVKKGFASSTVETEKNKELVTLKMLKNDIERSNKLKEDLEKKIRIIDSRIDEIKKMHGGKYHRVLMKEDPEYAELYNEKTRNVKRYNEVVGVLAYSFKMYFSINVGEEISISKYFEGLKEESLRK